MARDAVVRPEESLAALHPAIAAQWHPTKNGRLTPADVAPRSLEQVWWQCGADPRHVWHTQVHSRFRSHGCPLCSGKVATPATCLRAVRPDLAARWHPSRNGELTPDDVLPGSGRRVWWRCDVDARHVWEAQVVDVTRSGRGACPFCLGRRVTPETSLQTCFPEIAAEWHPTQNGALKPEDVTWRSHRRVSWRCGSCEHVWQATVASRGAAGSGCPVCAGRVATPATSLQALFPDVAREWHPSENGALTPDAVRPGTGKRVSWQCAADPRHVWQTTVNARTTHGSGCPFCTGQRAMPEATLAALHPRLSREWHPDKNAPRRPEDVHPGSARKAWWRCSKDPSHVWESAVAPRALKGVGCPMCAGKVATPRTSLAALHRKVAREWHPTRNEPLTPWDVRPGSGLKVWWRCGVDASHEWEAQIFNRTAGRKTGCPVCSGHLATPETSLRGRFPELAAQWHPTRNRPLTPDVVVPGSNRRVWWRCPVGRTHVWATAVANRTKRGDGCPHCSGRFRKAGAG